MRPLPRNRTEWIRAGQRVLAVLATLFAVPFLGALWSASMPGSSHAGPERYLAVRPLFRCIAPVYCGSRGGVPAGSEGGTRCKRPGLYCVPRHQRQPPLHPPPRPCALGSPRTISIPLKARAPARATPAVAPGVSPAGNIASTVVPASCKMPGLHCVPRHQRQPPLHAPPRPNHSAASHGGAAFGHRANIG